MTTDGYDIDVRVLTRRTHIDLSKDPCMWTVEGESRIQVTYDRTWESCFAANIVIQQLCGNGMYFG